jgi:predicted sulfurtransferase
MDETLQTLAASDKESHPMRPKLVLSAVVALLLSTGVSLGQEVPIQFIKVAEVNQLTQQGAKVVFVDVRSRQEYLIRHIKGAVSVPLNAIDLRTQEIPRDGIVVLY